MLKFTEKLKLENNNGIVVVTGMKQNDREVSAKLEMTKTQIEALERDSNLGKEIILTNYGKIIEFKWAD